MLKSLLIAVVVFSTLPITLFRVYVGVLTWSWLGYMNPHRLTYSFAYDFPWSQLVALATLGGMFISNEEKRFPLNYLSLSWIALLVWFVITTIFALYPDDAQFQLTKIVKIQLIAFITVMVMTSRWRLEMLIWVIVLSLGYYTIKGGVFTVMTGGAFRVWGPPGSFIEDNNHLACATLMLLPLMRYLMIISPNRWIRLALLFCMLSSAASAAGSHSRGALVAGLSMSVFLWYKSTQKLRTGLALLIILPALGLFMPQHYWDRMATIFHEDEETGEMEGSAQGRLNAWEFTFHLANDRFLGGGLNIWGYQELVDRYPPEEDHARAAHSIYFSVLGEHGWVGLFLFLLLWFNAWRMCNWLIRHTRHVEELKWAEALGRCVQISLIAYGTGGAFLSLAYFDLPYHLVAIVVGTQEIVRRRLEELAKQPAGEADTAVAKETAPASEPRLTDKRPSSRTRPARPRGGSPMEPVVNTNKTTDNQPRGAPRKVPKRPLVGSGASRRRAPNVVGPKSYPGKS